MLERPIYILEAREQQRPAEKRWLKKLITDISEEREKLGQWLIARENKQKVYFGMVEALHNFFYQEDEKKNTSWDFYHQRLADLVAINEAIYKGNTRDLSSCAEEHMKSKSLVLQIAGVLMLCLAAGLIVAGACMLSPLAFLGVLVGGVAYLAYEIGNAKMHTSTSRLFVQISEKMTSSKSPLVTVSDNDVISHKQY